MNRRRTMTRTTGNTHFGDFCVIQPGVEVEVWLRFYIVAEDAIAVPGRAKRKIIFAVRVKERSVEIHPPTINQIVCQRKAEVLSVLFGDVLFDSSRANGANYLVSLFTAVRKPESHEERASPLFHPGLDSRVLKRIVSLEVSLN